MANVNHRQLAKIAKKRRVKSRTRLTAIPSKSIVLPRPKVLLLDGDIRSGEIDRKWILPPFD